MLRLLQKRSCKEQEHVSSLESELESHIWKKKYNGVSALTLVAYHINSFNSEKRYIEMQVRKFKQDLKMTHDEL